MNMAIHLKKNGMVWYAFFVCFWKKSNAYQDFDHNTVNTVFTV